jgi:hypothetical protein
MEKQIATRHLPHISQSDQQSLLGDLGVDGKIILKWVLKKQGAGCTSMDETHLAQHRVEWGALIHMVFKLRTL